MTEVFGYGQNIEPISHNVIKIFSDTQVKIEIFKGSDYGKVFISTPSIPLGCNTWLETGDIGHYNQAEHTLHFYGRYKDIIIKSGSNIAPMNLKKF